MHRPINVGCMLQAYALQEAIKKLNFDCEIIDYGYPNAYHKQFSLKESILSLFNRQLKFLLGKGAFSLSKKRYIDFLENRLKLSKHYENIKELNDNPPEYDLYCVGSDQVWNPNYMRADPSFFCDFAPENKPIASYASSFGVSTIPDCYKDNYRKYLSRFSAIGVRESQGAQMIQELTSRKAEHVLDPTLLLDKKEWESVLPSINYKEPYILCYGRSIGDLYMERMAKTISNKLNLKIVRLEHTISHILLLQ